MYTLALDPGVTTGWALLDEKGQVLDCGNLKPDDLIDALDGLIRQVNRTGHELECVAERLAPGKQGPLAMTLRYVVTAIHHVVKETYGVNLVEYQPGEWKNSRHGRIDTGFVTWDSAPLTQHQKDAVALGRFRIAKRGRAMPPERWTA